MDRGDVWFVNFAKAVGGEIRKSRPAIIISNDASNKHLNRVQVVPVTSQVGRLYPSEALVRLKGKQHKAMADQITTISKIRLINKVGKISLKDIKKVERAIKIQLHLTDPLEWA